MANKILNIASIREEDITTPSATQKFPLGTEVTVQVEGTMYYTKYKYIQAHGALTANVPYVLKFTGTALETAAPVTGAGLVVVPQVAFTDDYFGFVAIEGYAECLHIQETYAVGDHLQILNGGAALVVDGSTGSTTRLVTSSAVTIDAGTTAIAGTVWLLGTKADIAAS